MTSKIEIILVRHGEVERQWKKICYGAMDVSLSECGRVESVRVAEQLSNSVQPCAVFQSGLLRTKFLADRIASMSVVEVPVIEDPRLRERNYGDWQGQTWDDAYASDPDHFQDLIEDPDHFRPPGGETTSEMQRRAVDWLTQQTERKSHASSQPIIAVTHSGPIAALAGHLLGLHPTRWAPWTIGTLESVRLRGVLNGENTQWKIDRHASTAPVV